MARLNPDVLRLYLVTDHSLMRGQSLADVVGAAVQGGVTCVQLSEKKMPSREFLAQALLLKGLLDKHHVPLVINDRIDIALACGAHGVHLGQIDMPVDVARKLLPVDVFIGWSVESRDDVLQSGSLPLDYLGVSPVFATSTKTDIKNIWGLDGLAQIRGLTNLPVVAIGGIHEGNAREVLLAGADGLAMVSALCASDDPKATASRLKSPCDCAIEEHFERKSRR